MFDTLTERGLRQRTVEWNMKRNKLEYDVKLERKMLHEEFREFMEAETLVDRLDAFVDFMFVFIGTEAKYLYSINHMINGEPLAHTDVQYLLNVDSYYEYMEQQVKHEVVNFLFDNEISEYFCYDVAGEVITKVYEIVLEANEQKTQVGADGKITKPADFYPPEGKIQELLINLKNEFKRLNEMSIGDVKVYRKAVQDA